MKRKDYRKMIQARAKQKKRAKMLMMGTMLAAPFMMMVPNSIAANAEVATFGADVKADGYIKLDGVTIPVPAGTQVITGLGTIEIDGISYNWEEAKTIELSNISFSEQAYLSYLNNVESMTVSNCTFAGSVGFIQNPNLTYLEVNGCDFKGAVEVNNNASLPSATFNNCSFLSKLLEYDSCLYAADNAVDFALYMNDCRYQGHGGTGHQYIYNNLGRIYFNQDESGGNVGPSEFVER